MLFDDPVANMGLAVAADIPVCDDDEPAGVETVLIPGCVPATAELPVGTCTCPRMIR